MINIFNHVYFRLAPSWPGFFLSFILMSGVNKPAFLIWKYHFNKIEFPYKSQNDKPKRNFSIFSVDTKLHRHLLIENLMALARQLIPPLFTSISISNLFILSTTLKGNNNCSLNCHTIEKCIWMHIHWNALNSIQYKIQPVC